jgi:hypothetical protein
VVERNLAKVDVAGSTPVSRSITGARVAPSTGKARWSLPLNVRPLKTDSLVPIPSIQVPKKVVFKVKFHLYNSLTYKFNLEG